MLDALPGETLPSPLAQVWDWQLEKALACASETSGGQPWVQCLAQGHWKIQTGGGG